MSLLMKIDIFYDQKQLAIAHEKTHSAALLKLMTKKIANLREILCTFYFKKVI